MALYTEKLAYTILNGQFVNWRGAAGKKVGNDLKKGYKTVFKGLVANKRLKVEEQETKVSCGLKRISNNVECHCS